MLELLLERNTKAGGGSIPALDSEVNQLTLLKPLEGEEPNCFETCSLLWP